MLKVSETRFEYCSFRCLFNWQIRCDIHTALGEHCALTIFDPNWKFNTIVRFCYEPCLTTACESEECRFDAKSLNLVTWRAQRPSGKSRSEKPKSPENHAPHATCQMSEMWLGFCGCWSWLVISVSNSDSQTTNMSRQLASIWSRKSKNTLPFGCCVDVWMWMSSDGSSGGEIIVVLPLTKFKKMAFFFFFYEQVPGHRNYCYLLKK